MTVTEGLTARIVIVEGEGSALKDGRNALIWHVVPALHANRTDGRPQTALLTDAAAAMNAWQMADACPLERLQIIRRAGMGSGCQPTFLHVLMNMVSVIIIYVALVLPAKQVCLTHILTLPIWYAANPMNAPLRAVSLKGIYMETCHAITVYGVIMALPSVPSRQTFAVDIHLAALVWHVSRTLFT
ncbi:MAG: hypothetical protein HYX24_01030 [Candidatus Aenigmarchaeota archaeon]|nr:hypothetical protein [Candidatus Aenigmarchaeota archaeon]